MTHRRLYLYLLLLGAFVLAGTWWNSLKTGNAASLALPLKFPLVSGGVGAAVYCGTASLTWGPEMSTSGSTFLSFKVADLRPGDRYGPMGNFMLGTPSDEDGRPMRLTTIQLPLWFVYLLFAGGGFLLMRRAEKRSAASGEKALALRNAGEAPALENAAGTIPPTR